jgi:hypothetical protein
MSDFLEAVQYRTPYDAQFDSTLAQCGTDNDKFDFIIHCLSWVRRQSPPITLYKCNLYFSSPSIFMSIFTKFGRAVEGDNTFKQFIELITVERGGANVPVREIDDLVRQIKRITPPPIQDQTQAFYESIRGIDWMVRVESLRKKWLEYFKLYWKHAASWPVNNDTSVFETFRTFLLQTLLVPQYSALETEYIDAYKKIESNLGTLTSIDMQGAGLPPLFLSFGPDFTDQQWTDFRTFAYSDPTGLQAWKDSIITAINGVRRETDKLDELDLIDATYERHFMDDIKRFIFNTREVEKYFDKVSRAADVKDIPSSGNTALDLAAKEWWEKRITESQINEQERRVVTAEGVLEQCYGDNVFTLPWEQQMVPNTDEGIMGRWYDWASQFWLKDAHNKWFNTIAKLSRSGEIQEIFQSTQIILIDDASFGADRYTKFGLNVLSAPQLVYVFTMRNKSPWWRPPSMEESTIKTDAAIDVEEIESETDRMEIIYGRLNDLKKSINEGLLLNNANVVFYTTTPSFIGYCLFNDIDIVIYNLWLSKSPISIKNLRDWVLRDYTLCGQATRHVSTKTRLLTFIALLALSTSSGIPMYVGFGWDNIYSQWRNIIKEFSKLVPPSRQKADETCAWLAKMPSDEIIINKQLMVPLFARVLHSKFAGDKKPTPLKSDYTLWNNKYKELFTEERIGTGRVEPVPVLSSWDPFMVRYYQPKEQSSESSVRSRIKEEERIRKAALDERYNRAMVEWRANLANYNTAQEQKNTDVNDAEKARLRDKNVVIINKLKNLNDEQKELEKDIKAVDANNMSRKRLQTLMTSYPQKLKRLKDKQETLKQELSGLTNYGYIVGGEGYEKTQAFSRVVGNIIALENDAQGWEADIINLDTAITLGNEGLKNRRVNIMQIKDNLDKIIQTDGGVGEAILTNGVWSVTFDLATTYQKYLNDYIGYSILSEGEYALIEERPTRTKIVTIDQSLEGSLKTDDMMPITTISSVVKIRKDVTDSMEDVNRAASEKLLADIKCVEWAYAQRCHFQDHYYAPKDFDKLIITFGIRFKDWTGAKTITINN